MERPDGTVDLAARTPIAMFEERFGPVLTGEERAADIDTVGGLVFTLAGIMNILSPAAQLTRRLWRGVRNPEFISTDTTSLASPPWTRATSASTSSNLSRSFGLTAA